MQQELKRTQELQSTQKQHEQPCPLTVDTSRLARELQRRQELQQNEREALLREINRERVLICHIEGKLQEERERREAEEKRAKWEEAERDKRESQKLREDKVASLELSIATLHAYLEKHAK